MNEGERLARLEERVTGIDLATKVAKAEVDRRLNGMNAMRAQIDTERGTLVSCEKFESTTNALDVRLDAVEDRMTQIESDQRSNRRFIAVMFTVGALSVSMVSILANVLT